MTKSYRQYHTLLTLLKTVQKCVHTTLLKTVQKAGTKCD